MSFLAPESVSQQSSINNFLITVTLRKALSYGKLVNGVDVCKFGKQWVVSTTAMKRAYGEAKGSAVSRTHWPFFDHQLTTGSDFCCRWSFFIVDTLFYIACARCSIVVQNQQKIALYHRIACRVVVLRLNAYFRLRYFIFCTTKIAVLSFVFMAFRSIFSSLLRVVFLRCRITTLERCSTQLNFF